MARKKRQSKRTATKKKKRFASRRWSDNPQQPLALSGDVHDLARALDALPLPARAIFDQQQERFAKFKRQYPRLYDVMFKDIDSEYYRKFERHLEEVQEQKRGSS